MGKQRKKRLKRSQYSPPSESEFGERTPMFEKLRDEARFVVEKVLGSSGIRIHSVSSRIKTFKSFSEKAQRYQFSDPYAQMHDVLGVRIVCLFLSDVKRIGKLIERAFDVHAQDDKIDGGDASSFGYMSHHFIVKMKSTYAGPRYDDIAGQLFEIQVRTIAMDAWAATSHYLDYKSEVDVPSDLRRDFFALSGLFYVADRHFEMFFNARKEAVAAITSSLAQPSPNWDQELNLDSLNAYLIKSFPDRTPPDGSDLSSLLEELAEAGMTNVKDVKGLVDKGLDWFIGYEKLRPPASEDLDDPDEPPDYVGRFTASGVVRVILRMGPSVPNIRAGSS